MWDVNSDHIVWTLFHFSKIVLALKHFIVISLLCRIEYGLDITDSDSARCVEFACNRNFILFKYKLLLVTLPHFLVDLLT